jgi:hypothetical protein
MPPDYPTSNFTIGPSGFQPLPWPAMVLPTGPVALAFEAIGVTPCFVVIAQGEPGGGV